MEIRSRLSGDILKLKLRGHLDSVSAEDFYSYLKSKWEEGIRKFLFSCEELEYIESEGICVLARFENFLKNRGASSAYCAFNEECKTLLSFLGFGRSIAFFEDLQRAEEYLSLIKIQDQRRNRSASTPISRIKKILRYNFILPVLLQKIRFPVIPARCMFLRFRPFPKLNLKSNQRSLKKFPSRRI
ncbi:STAS domain protein [Leptospira borgpetersenii str. 200701203]|uniref:STAS domain protein n=1 Tax=Leptospira borgpetersenii str. 200701203 TaxID=1193007 RepID=M3HQ46_LEPBO|nr:STAS domain protein [Leptospira borgpetersenii str. 200701203]